MPTYSKRCPESGLFLQSLAEPSATCLDSKPLHLVPKFWCLYSNSRFQVSTVDSFWLWSVTTVYRSYPTQAARAVLRYHHGRWTHFRMLFKHSRHLTNILSTLITGGYLRVTHETSQWQWTRSYNLRVSLITASKREISEPPAMVSSKVEDNNSFLKSFCTLGCCVRRSRTRAIADDVVSDDAKMRRLVMWAWEPPESNEHSLDMPNYLFVRDIRPKLII